MIEKPHSILWRVLLAAMRDSDKSHLIYMAIRLLETKRLLKSTGFVFLHCDPAMSNYLKLVVETVYEQGNYCSKITCRVIPSWLKEVSMAPEREAIQQIQFCSMQDRRSIASIQTNDRILTISSNSAC